MGLDADDSSRSLPTGSGKLTAKDVATPGLLLKGGTSGLAWASRRDILDVHGLYDACVVGSGNIAVLSAALGVHEYFAQAIQMNPRRTEHYRAWARPYFDRVRGRVGHIPGRIFYLWHGHLDDRQHQARHRPFARFDFDPYTDIAVAPNGCWRWSSDKAEMHAFVKGYFQSRREDGT